MWRFFRLFDNVVDVFVPQKHAKNRGRFGFVWFKGVRDMSKLIDLVTEEWAGTDHVVMNKTKFERSQSDSSPIVKKSAGVKNYYLVPGWQSKATPQTHSNMSYVEVAHCQNLAQVQASCVREEELTWLKRCLLAEVKNHDLINDLSYLFEDAGFLSMKVKYTGGLRVLLECSSIEAAQKVLNDGAHTFSSWFTLVCPWSMEKEVQGLGKLLWLSIAGVPLHVWTHDTFKAIANVFGRVLEVEDWTEEKEQTHIGRVLILSNLDKTISESICLMVDGHGFSVNVFEDVVEIINFGPRYELDGYRSEISTDEGSGYGDGLHNGPPEDSEAEETAAGLMEKAKRSCQLSGRQLRIVEALITSSHMKSEELEEGEIWWAKLRVQMSMGLGV